MVNLLKQEEVLIYRLVGQMYMMLVLVYIRELISVMEMLVYLVELIFLHI